MPGQTKQDREELDTVQSPSQPGRISSNPSGDADVSEPHRQADEQKGPGPGHGDRSVGVPSAHETPRREERPPFENPRYRGR